MCWCLLNCHNWSQVWKEAIQWRRIGRPPQAAGASHHGSTRHCLLCPPGWEVSHKVQEWAKEEDDGGHDSWAGAQGRARLLQQAPEHPPWHCQDTGTAGEPVLHHSMLLHQDSSYHCGGSRLKQNSLFQSGTGQHQGSRIKKVSSAPLIKKAV